jgi:hypothetical protein
MKAQIEVSEDDHYVKAMFFFDENFIFPPDNGSPLTMVTKLFQSEEH